MIPEEEADISQLEWLAAAETVEMKTFEHHKATRCDPLKAHHRNVLEIARAYDWGPARIYDKRTRELMASDLQHDPRIVNESLVTQANFAFGMEKLNAKMLSQQSQFIRQPTSYHPSSMSFQNTISPFPAPSSLSITSSSSSSARRFNPYDQSGRQPRSDRSNLKCFRCGVNGHMSASCDSKSTSAGLPCASWTKRPGARSGVLVDETSRRTFCSAWAQNSTCRFSDHCKFFHRCHWGQSPLY